MRNEIIAEAKRWVDTPYQHQAMLKGVGADCVGLVVGVGLTTGVLNLTRSDIKAYSGYGRLPNPRQMRKVLEQHAEPIPHGTEDAGDIAWIEWRQNLPMHLALIGRHKGVPTLIHSAANIGRVVEHALTKEWEERITSYWRYPGLMA